MTLRLHLISRLGDKLVLAGMGDTVAMEHNSERHDLVVGFLERVVAGDEAPEIDPIRATILATGSTPASIAGSLRKRMFVPPDLLQTFDVPVLVLNGDTDQDNGSGEALAALIPGARLQLIEGTHISAVSNPDLVEAIVSFMNES